MFDMQKIGQTIARLRKQNRITQMELADKLSISFQAISNWERGNTMPDISKLSELSQIFNVSIDEILGNKRSAEIIDKINSGDKTSKIDATEFAEVAPILKPEQAEEIADDLDGDMSISNLVSIAPFVSEEFLDKIVEEKLSESNVEIGSIVALAPFVSEETLNKVAQKLAVTDLSKLASIAPFLEEKTLAEIALNIKTENFAQLTSIAPFLSEEVLGEIVKKVPLDDCSKIVALAPFLKEEDLNEIASKLIKEKGFKAIIPIAPFLDNMESFLKKK